MDLFFWRSQGNVSDGVSTPPPPEGRSVYRIAGIWRDEDGSKRPDYEAKFHVYCSEGEFHQHDKIACDEDLYAVLSKKFILIPISEKP